MDFPPCIWANIFAFFEIECIFRSLLTLNRHYSRLVQDHACWKVAVFGRRGEKSQITDSTIEHLACRSFRHLKYLDLRTCPNITDTAMLAIGSHIKNLCYLNLTHCKLITDVGLGRLAPLASSLRELYLTLVPVSDIGIQKFFAACEYSPLETLNLNHVPHISDESLSLISRKCPRISDLGLANCKSISDLGIKIIAENFLRIRQLQLAGGVKISDEGIAHLAACRPLESVDLNHCLQLTDAGIGALIDPSLFVQPAPYQPFLADSPPVFDHSAIFQSLQYRVRAPLVASLRVLSLRQCPQLTSAGVAYLAYFTSLVDLDLGNLDLIDDDAITIFLRQAGSNLRSLNLYYCRNLSDVSLKAIGSFCPNLTKLNVTNFNKATHIGLEALVQGCPRLVQLVLSQCRSISAEGFKHLARLTHLERVALILCQVTDEVIQAISTGCPSLAYLDLSWCRSVTDESLKALASGVCALSLREINFSYCQISDAGLLHLSRGCPNLSAIDAICTQATRSVAPSLIARLPSLQKFKVRTDTSTKIRQYRSIAGSVFVSLFVVALAIIVMKYL
eukprot:TRINITY_DN11676_c0_g1_i3.p1 TRINITY_DN11676_c0_g1~~TRINITY_DN11676_c0_g1_i3.p1  ORF type:complete len:563 (-),score=53.97 TRINITY_DN11676_c0_g1_i3:29-1717(-)